MSYTPPEVLDRLVMARAAGRDDNAAHHANTRTATAHHCVVCGCRVSTTRIRCKDCPVPALPADYLNARRKLRADLDAQREGS